LATKVAPTAPPAPGRFSTTTGCPSAMVSRSASARASTSVPLPAVIGAMNLIGRFG
jgi:hypothetical protein